MPTNQWLAIDAATPVRSHARELRRAWEAFVGDGEAAAARAPIPLSWERSHAAGVDPFQDRAAPIVADADEVSARWEVHPLAATAPLILECVGAVVDEAEDLIAVSDAEGMLLWIEGNARERLGAADTINFTEGAGWRLVPRSGSSSPSAWLSSARASARCSR
jgi:transcriptional regulator of acetoin/glycerol metabolism